VGFGSLLYPDYCKFAIDVDKALEKHSDFSAHLPLFKINNQSEEAFKNWVKQWNESRSYDIKLKPEVKKIKGLKPVKVTNVSELNADDTYLMSVKPQKNFKFNSGDLLAFYPEEDLVERQYSVAKVGDEILLSIKRHEQGVCSNYLFNQQPGSILKAKLKRNPDFHLPAQAKEVLMISNGTGIAPFLGMVNERPNIKKHLFWGGRTTASYRLYEKYISRALKHGNLDTFEMALSRGENDGRYVQELIFKYEDFVLHLLANDGVIMICGAIAMQNRVLDLLEELCQKRLSKPLSHFENNEQLKMDCY
jgi:sulfite reductase (NADPH) flavoprotein alpha-component